MALEWMKHHLGEDVYNALARLSPNLYDREPNFGPYSALEMEDMSHTVMLLESTKGVAFLAIIGRTDNHTWFDYNGKVDREDLVPEHWEDAGDSRILVYLFIAGSVVVCGTGRPLYAGPFTKIWKTLPIQRSSDPLLMPLHNFLCGRIVPEPNERHHQLVCLAVKSL